MSKSWERLNERFGLPEIVTITLQKRVEQLPRLNLSDNTKWYDLEDLCSEVQALKEDPVYATSLSYYDSSVGLSHIVSKLPTSTQEKWTARASRYKENHNVYFPSLTEFVKFLHEQAKIRNDPSLFYLQKAQTSYTPPGKTVVNNRITDVYNVENKPSRFCPLHKSNHSLNKCRVFQYKSLNERKQFLRENEICFKCCEFNNHKAIECKVPIKCRICGNVIHTGAIPTSSRCSEEPKRGEKEHL